MSCHLSAGHVAVHKGKSPRSIDVQVLCGTWQRWLCTQYTQLLPLCTTLDLLCLLPGSEHGDDDAVAPSPRMARVLSR